MHTNDNHLDDVLERVIAEIAARIASIDRQAAEHCAKWPEGHRQRDEIQAQANDRISGLNWSRALLADTRLTELASELRQGRA